MEGRRSKQSDEVQDVTSLHEIYGVEILSSQHETYVKTSQCWENSPDQINDVAFRLEKKPKRKISLY